ncbi:MAG: capsular polysaccharide biosynthesis protein [Campylobacteraceae bacterium]|jgi:capsular polysaccharide export protein|nr:capsular polysaccharide biosynthesis protein [Campylobacteraceae bacterium]
MIFSASKRLIKNAGGFLEIKHYSFSERISKKSGVFCGWGRKKSGLEAVYLAKKFNTAFLLLEDGFIRSSGLESDLYPSFSIVEDSIGIYYDATHESALERILNSYDFKNDKKLLAKAKEAISFIAKYNISKYNHARDLDENYFPNNGKKRILIIAQTKNDASLKYGLADKFSIHEMIKIAKDENKNADIYLKIHPQALKKAKTSDISVQDIPPYCKLIIDDINPISLLKKIDKVYTKTSQMGFEALLLGKECTCFGMPFYAGWGVTEDKIKCERRTKKRSVEEIFAAAYILYAKYRDPYKNTPLTLMQTLQSIIRIKNAGLHKKAFFFGFSRWKHNFIKPFFEKEKFAKIFFINSFFQKNHLKNALKNGLDENSLICVWGKKTFQEVEKYAERHGIPILRTEDGFIRSVELGSDLSRPYSLVVDKYGIYFDAAQKSELEQILNETDFDEKIIKKAKKIQAFLVKERISKYNISVHESIHLKTDNKVIFAVGQVDDDASIIYGSQNMSNLALLKKAREENPQSYIIYKPHPDVLAKNRAGKLSENEALQYADKIVKNASLDALFEICDEVHTITSLVGFEAILRGKKVVTYGMPFYAGWGLSSDMIANNRRKRKLNIYELIAGVLILYPRYISPKNHKLCDIKTFLSEFKEEKKGYNSNKKISKKILTFFIRKIQFIYRAVKI